MKKLLFSGEKKKIYVVTGSVPTYILCYTRNRLTGAVEWWNDGGGDGGVGRAGGGLVCVDRSATRNARGRARAAGRAVSSKRGSRSLDIGFDGQGQCFSAHAFVQCGARARLTFFLTRIILCFHTAASCTGPRPTLPGCSVEGIC